MTKLLVAALQDFQGNLVTTIAARAHQRSKLLVRFEAAAVRVALASRPQAEGIGASLGLAKDTVAVQNTREIGKKALKLNDATPHVEVHPETYEVRADGELLTCQPAEVLPMAQRYFLF